MDSENRFVDSVLTYIAGYIMRMITKKEKCTLCYTYMTECKERVSCELINVKQLGGLVYPTFDFVSVVRITNRNMKLFLLLFQLHFSLMPFEGK